MAKISFILSDSGRIAATINGKAFTVAPDHARYKDIVQAIRDDDPDQFVKLVDAPAFLPEYTAGHITIRGNTVTYKDRTVNSTLTLRLIQMMTAGFPFEPFVRFLDNLMENPSRRATEELHRWMQHNDIPITDDGFWLGYKRLHATGAKTWVFSNLQDEVPQHVLDNVPTPEARAANGWKEVDVYVDCHNKAIRQWVGKLVDMPRNTVDENWGRACSEGLHVGNKQYVDNFEPREALTTVKVNPRDVVSVPSGENKCRVCVYEIIEINKGAFTSPVVGPRGEEIEPDEPDEDEDDSVDEDDDDVNVEYTVTVTLADQTTADEFGALQEAINALILDNPLEGPNDESGDNFNLASGKIVTYVCEDAEDNGDAEAIRKAANMFRFVTDVKVTRSPPEKPKLQPTSEFPITFDIEDANGHLLSSHSVRNDDEEKQVMERMSGIYTGCKQVNRNDERQE